MDGSCCCDQVCAGRERFRQTRILSYAAKYASAYYGPFAMRPSAPNRVDRKGLSNGFRKFRRGDREVLADIDEGADAIMVKPAGPYLESSPG